MTAANRRAGAQPLAAGTPGSATLDFWAGVGREIAPPMPPVSAPDSPLQQRRRRGFDAHLDDGRAAVELVRDDGVLRWVYQPSLQRRATGRRAWRSIGAEPGATIRRFEYPELGRNQITQGLVDLDFKLNPIRGLRRWHTAQDALGKPLRKDKVAGTWQPLAQGELESLTGRVLLLVHGTFSKSEMYDSELGATQPGTELFQRLTLGRPYSAVLAFDHATLSVAPWLNALALKDALFGATARIDVVCHSRGGLVTSWALKLGMLPIDQVVFVGSPLMGTSLAAPNRLREALDLLANLSDAIAATSHAAAVAFPPALPLAMGTAGLATVLGRVLNLGASLPLADAVVGLVPGLMSQSRVENNLELAQLFPLPANVKLRGIGVAFRPDEIDQPIWRFWKRFSNLTDQAKYLGADLIFAQPNDLVVDFDSMNQLGPTVAGMPNAPRISGTEWRVLQDARATHHCSYFRNAEAAAQLDAWLR